MKKKYVIISSALVVMVAHIGLLPFIYFYLDNAIDSQRNDLALLVAPLTAAYFITITKFVIDNGTNMDIGSESVNILYVISSVLIVFPFLIAIYYLIHTLNTAQIDFEKAKGSIGLIEIFFGGAFALFVDNLFGKPAPAP